MVHRLEGKMERPIHKKRLKEPQRRESTLRAAEGLRQREIYLQNIKKEHPQQFVSDTLK